MSKYSDLMNRYNQASANWDNWRSLYDEAYSFTFPNKNPFWEEYNETPGARKNLQIFDNTLLIGARQLVSKLHANLVPPSLEWFTLEPSEIVEDENTKKELQASLQDLTKIIYNAINGSNFDLAINEAFHDLIIGTCAIQIFATDNDKRPLVFKTCPVDELAPEQDAFDSINTVWRSFKDVHNEDIKRLWPRATFTSGMVDRIAQQPQTKFDLIEGVIYEPERDRYNIVVMTRDESDFIVNEYSPSSPWIVGRWSKSSKEIGGRGAAIEALPSARTLNMMARFLMEAAALAATPPWLGFSDGVFNPYTYTIKPNDIIPIAPESALNLPLKKLDVSGNVQFGELTMNDLRSQINQIMYVDPTRPVQAPSMTATEIMIRQQQFLEEIAPAFARIEIEILPKLINRVIYILAEKGLIPNPDNYKDLYQVRFKSPLEQSQQLQDVQKLIQYNQSMQSILGQEVTLMTYKLPQLPTYLATKFDIDLDLINSPQEIEDKIAIAQSNMLPNPNQNQAPDSTTGIAESATPQTMGLEGGQ